MLSRRHLTKATSNPVSPPLTSGSVSHRRSPNLIAHQQSLRAPSAQTVEAGSFVSETSPGREFPPVPLQPVSFPPLPPGNSGPRWQQTRHDTQETLWSPPFGEYAPIQPPNAISMPTPSISRVPGPSFPMQFHHPVPGGGVGGFALNLSPHHEPSRDHPHYNTADFTHGFYPTTHLDSNSPPHETADISEGPHAGVWPTYNKVSQGFDKKRLKKWNEDLNTLLIFSSLFSAIVTAFFIKAIEDFQPDYQQQTALLLHQLLNGRDPNLANVSDPTIPKKPSGLTVAVGCLWCASMTLSLSACIYTMALKSRLTEYDGDAGLFGGFIGACQRHIRFEAFERSDVPALIPFLPKLLIFSTTLFFVGGVIYVSQINRTLMASYATTDIILHIAYFHFLIYPSMKNIPRLPYPAFIFYWPSSAIGKAVMRIVNVFVRLCYIILRCVIATIFSAIHAVCAVINSPREHDDTDVRRGTPIHDPRDGIDTSQKVQEDAILWLSRVPLDPIDSKALVPSLALISSSRPCGGFQGPIIILANSVLEASLREEVGLGQTNTAIDCVHVLGNIKFRSAVDQNLDRDHNIGGIPVPHFAARVAQQLTSDAFQADSDTTYSAEIQGRLLTATAWLSPVDGAKDVSLDSHGLKIQDRWEFIEKIRMMLERHIRSDEPQDKKVLINLIHGMHAYIPRGNYGRASSTVPFLSIFCENYDSPWSNDEAVVGALITYALDLLLPPERRKPLASRRIGFDDLALELIDALVANTTHSDVVTLALRLAHRVPYVFRSRKMVLVDIAHIWHRTNETTPEDYRGRLNFHATDAFIAVVQHHVVTNVELPRLTDYTALRLLSAALGSGYSRLMTIYTMAVILNPGTSTQLTSVTSEIEVEPIIDALFSGSGDPEKAAVEEDAVDIRIYSALILLKISPTVELDAGRVKGLIVQMEEAIGEPSVRDPGVAKGFDADVGVDRARWKAIYLSALLFEFVPADGREKHIEGLRTRVRALLESGELSFMGDCELCLEPLGRDVLELGTSAADQQGQTNTVFEAWIGGFPLFRLAGVVSELPLGRKHGRRSFLTPGGGSNRGFSRQYSPRGRRRKGILF